MILRTTVELDDSIKKLSLDFDYQFDGESVVNLPDPERLPERDGSWSCGLIVGSSGSGKSTLSRERYGITPEPNWNASQAIISQVSHEKLAAVGLNTVPSWCRPYHVLSNGEAFRARMAKSLDSDTCFDEFTSVVDRSVAKSCSCAIRRYIDGNKLKGVVFVSCHRDISDWLRPDWIFDTDSEELVYSSDRGCLRRPKIKLDIYESRSEGWKIFAKHHYLTGEINKSARCFYFYWEGNLVAFSSVLPFPNGAIKNAVRGHRLVVLPEYQGLGIGVRISNWVASLFVGEGKRFFSKTSNHRLGGYRNSKPEIWRPTSKNMIKRKDYKNSRKTKESAYKHLHADRTCYSHEYIGEAFSLTLP